MKKHIFVITMILMLVWVSSGYGAMEVFVSIPPQKWLVDKVGGELVNTTILVKEGQDPHTFEPSPRQLAALSRAEIWFTMNMEFEQQLVRKVAAVAPGLRIVDITSRVERIAMAASDHEHDKEHHLASDKHDPFPERLDPHVWLSPLNLQLMSVDVAEALGAADPGNAVSYTARQAEAQKELNELHQDIMRQLKPYSGSSFYVFHPSFGYFAHTYNLVQEPVEIEGKSPGPRQLSRLIAKARAERVKVIFVQPQFDPKSARAVAAAIGGDVVPLDSLAEDVAANLKMMATKIEAALVE